MKLTGYDETRKIFEVKIRVWNNKYFIYIVAMNITEALEIFEMRNMDCKTYDQYDLISIEIKDELLVGLYAAD